MSNSRFFLVPEKPMSVKDLDEKIFEFIEERNKRYNPKGAIGATGATGPAVVQKNTTKNQRALTKQ